MLTFRLHLYNHKMAKKSLLEKPMFLFGWLFVICILVSRLKGSVYPTKNNHFTEGRICLLEWKFPFLTVVKVQIIFKCSSYLKDKSGCFVSQQVESISSSELEITSLRLVNLILILQENKKKIGQWHQNKTVVNNNSSFNLHL